MSETDLITLQIRVEKIMELKVRQLEEIIAEKKINNSPDYPRDYLAKLPDNDRELALKAVIIGLLITGGRETPREHQVHAVRMSLSKDSAILAGTGSGKTFIIAILIWMTGRKRVCITLCPLKRLQKTLADDLGKKYSVPTLAINGETDRTALFWKENVWGPNRTLGKFRHFLVTPEQLFTLKEGYYSRFGHTIRDPDYKKLIGRIFVDEAHFIYFAGQSRYTLPAFRPAFGQLSDIKAMFSGVPWHALTATAPPHVYDQISSSILTRAHALIRYSSNRPNTVYATHQIIGSVNDMFNYDMFIQEPSKFNFHTHPRVLLFFDNKKLCKAVCEYLRTRLPAEGLPYAKKEIVRYYRGSMSTGFLQRAHEAFAVTTGSCRIYCTTKSNSTGMDYPDVDIVGNVDIPEDASESLQRGGRVIRRLGKNGIYLVLYENWVKEINLDSYTSEHKDISLDDPDRPRAPLTSKSTRQDRAPLSMVSMVQDEKKCLRQFYSEYLNDTTDTVLEYHGPHCCNRHDDGFDLQSFLPGIIPTAAPVPATDEKTRTYNKYRQPVSDRDALENRLRQWRRTTHQTDPLRAVYLEDYIIRDKAIKTVSCALPEKVKSPELLQALLDETDEWKEGSSLRDRLQV